MNGIGGWAGSGAGVIMIGACVLLMRYMTHLPAAAHVWLGRAAITGMYCGGAAIAVTTIGQQAIRLLRWALGFAGGGTPGSGLGWAFLILTALFLTITVAVAIKTADMLGAYTAVILPLVLAVPAAGFLHQVYADTTYPSQQAVLAIAHWIGG